MSKEYVTVRNLDTGGVSKVRKQFAEHPIFGARLEIVPEGTKKKILIPTRISEPAMDLQPVEPVVEEVVEDKVKPTNFKKKVKNV